jgi:hypothetical protein
MGISFLFLVQWKTINNSALELLLLEKKRERKVTQSLRDG